jgi:N-acetylglucosamine-6-phosphate deacetylase
MQSFQLAYSAYPEGCILITDAMKILDPNLKDGVHAWRDGENFVKEGDKLYLEGTDTLAGRSVSLYYGPFWHLKAPYLFLQCRHS